MLIQLGVMCEAIKIRPTSRGDTELRDRTSRIAPSGNLRVSFSRLSRSSSTAAVSLPSMNTAALASWDRFSDRTTADESWRDHESKPLHHVQGVEPRFVLEGSDEQSTGTKYVEHRRKERRQIGYVLQDAMTDNEILASQISWRLFDVAALQNDVRWKQRAGLIDRCLRHVHSGQHAWLMLVQFRQQSSGATAKFQNALSSQPGVLPNLS